MSELRERLQAALGDAYALERELGGGGMARVFVARDVELGRRVVVKVLAPHLAAGVSAHRFEREVRLEARLQHPHVLPLLSAGRVDGLPYYTSPFVQGETLRARLARDGALPVSEVVRLVRELADALAYAHSEGVVHRDLKPENVLLSGGHAVVADFGVAKAIASATHDGAHPAGVTAATDAGMAVGTPAYMAPEQVAGDPATDHRADLYALGLIAYELLAGAHPFGTRSPASMLGAQVTESAAPIASVRPDAPVALDTLVTRLLAKRPEDRPQSASEIVTLLDATATPVDGMRARGSSGGWRRRAPALAALSILAIVVAAAIGVVTARQRDAAAISGPPVLAVLPFENVGPAADAYFADGLTEEVRGRLAGLTGLRVIGGTSARQYRGTTKPARAIARELGATHVLSGTVRWEGTAGSARRVRVSPELVRASDDATLWAEPSDATLADAFQVQSRIAGRVAAALDVALLARERPSVAAPPTRNPAAYDAYLRGLASVSAATVFSTAARRVTVAEFERAVTLDPSFAAAHARLALAYLSDRTQEGDTTAASLERIGRAAARAWALDSNLVDSRIARASYLASARDLAAAYELAREAQHAAPANVEVLTLLAELALQASDAAQALDVLRRAVALDPRSAYAWGQLAGSYDRLYRHGEAIAVREREIALVPDAQVTYAAQAASHLLRDADTLAARRTLERAGVAPAWIVRFPGGIAGGAIWGSVLPPALVHARDTLTLAGYRAGAGGIAPELYHLMKLRHLTLARRPDGARAHADSIVSLLAPPLRRGVADATWFFGWYSRRIVLAEAYASLVRPEDARRETDRYLDDTRRWLREGDGSGPEQLCHALHNGAYVDALTARRDSAVARLTEALALPCGHRVSRPLLRADPSWAVLRGHPAFERLIAETR